VPSSSGSLSELFLGLIQDLDVGLDCLFPGSSLDEGGRYGLGDPPVRHPFGNFSFAELLNQTCTFLDDFGVSLESGGNRRWIRLGPGIP
jgi:hypothetical protein